jgi:hypothetical protein
MGRGGRERSPICSGNTVSDGLQAVLISAIISADRFKEWLSG